MEVVMKQITAKRILQAIVTIYKEKRIPTIAELSLGEEVYDKMQDRATDDTLIHLSLSPDQVEAVKSLLSIEDFPIFV